MKNKIAFALISSVAVAISSIANIKPAQAETNLGGLDLARYCYYKYHTYRGTKAISGNGAYSWLCRMPLTIFSDWPNWDFGIDTQEVCRQQKNNSRAYARALNDRDAYSWQCFKP
jgi:hypothetical protein